VNRMDQSVSRSYLIRTNPPRMKHFCLMLDPLQRGPS
jgi:hypothetical protein